MLSREAAGFITPTVADQRPWLWTVSILSLLYSFTTLGARLVAKWEILWYDDAILGIGYAFSIAHWGTLFRAITAGLGKSGELLSTPPYPDASKFTFGSRILLLVSLFFSKLSLLVFTRRIFSGDMSHEKPIFGIVLASVIVWAVLALCLSSIGCTPTTMLLGQEDALCAANAVRWRIITALDVLTEFAIISTPVYFVIKSQLHNSKKRLVIAVFSIRIIVAILAIAQMASYLNFLKGGPASIGLVRTVALQEALLCYSLVSSTVPCLRALLLAFMSRGLRALPGDTPTPSYGQSVMLQSLKSHDSKRPGGTSASSAAPLRPGSPTYKADIMHEHLSGEGASVASEASGGKDHISHG